jgi:adenosylcobinamide-GDP ribazoletransferase
VNRLREFAAALMLLTRLPIWRLQWEMPIRPSDALWAYPLVGTLVGAIGAAIFALCRHVGPLPAAVLTVAVQVLIIGAMHEDGLADMADGFGGGTGRERKLEIMRDSRVGSYGALALCLLTLLRVSALAQATQPWVALIVAATLSRTAMLAVLATTPAARRDGLAAALADFNRAPVLAGGAIALLVALAMLPLASVVAACALALAIAALIRWLALRQIGGQTGDVLGGVCALTEAALLLLLSAS